MGKFSDELRQSVLQAAIQGKLTEQKPEDGTAEELLEQIRAEKERLVKEKKIKKEKPLAPITDDDVPFDIPENWEWMQLGECISLLSGADFDPGNYNDANNGIPYMTGASNIENNHLVINRWTLTPRCIAYKGDLLVVCKGSGYGKTVICDVEECHIARQFMAIRKLNNINQKYIKALLDYYFDYIKSKGQGIIPGIERKTVLSLALPLPPLAEQHRIVARVEALMAKIDELERIEDSLDKLHQSFPGDMKAALLQAAMQGKLTKQLPEDGTAEELLEQIKAEKEKLVREKKIKKEKPLAPITEDEVPFEIPGNWRWIRLGNLFQIINGDRGKNYPSKDKLSMIGTIPFISAINMNENTVSQDGLLFLSEQQYDLLGSGKLQKNDFVFCLRGSLGKHCRYPFEIGAIASSLAILRKYFNIEDGYINIYLDSALISSQINSSNNGTAQPNLGARDIAKYLIPLPPLAEQHRIVAILDKLLPLCDSLQV